MRYRALILVYLFSSSAYADLKTAEDFFSIAKNLRATQSPSKQKKISKLKEFEKLLTDTQKKYEAKNPKKGDEAEKKVNAIYFTFEPAFNAKTFDSAECKKVQYTIEFEDSTGKGEDEPLSPEAKEALEWIKWLCR